MILSGHVSVFLFRVFCVFRGIWFRFAALSHYYPSKFSQLAQISCANAKARPVSIFHLFVCSVASRENAFVSRCKSTNPAFSCLVENEVHENFCKKSVSIRVHQWLEVVLIGVIRSLALWLRLCCAVSIRGSS